MDGTGQPLVVIIEGDSGMRRALSRLVAAAGYCACAFQSAEDAARSRELASAGCLVLDMQMPGMSGAQWYASLAEGRPPAVFITACDRPDAGAIADGHAHACLTKPFEGRALLDAITRAVNRPRAC